MKVCVNKGSMQELVTILGILYRGKVGGVNIGN